MDCSVIIPVGPGHEKLAQTALQSVMLAAQAPGPFESIYVILGDDTQGDKGRSTARNRMVSGNQQENGNITADPWMMIFTGSEETDMSKAFRTDWLFFLDADDLMCCPELFGESPFSVVEPYVADYDAIWGAIYEMHPGGQILRRKQTNTITTYDAYVKTPAALSCQMGHFVRRDKFPGFKEFLDVCEDIDLYLREWKELRCIKQEKPLFLNRRGEHSWLHTDKTSKRNRPTGRDWSIKAEQMLKVARNEL